MRISDWISDVCSSDLVHGAALPARLQELSGQLRGAGIFERAVGDEAEIRDHVHRTRAVRQARIGLPRVEVAPGLQRLHAEHGEAGAPAERGPCGSVLFPAIARARRRKSDTHTTEIQ